MVHSTNWTMKQSYRLNHETGQMFQSWNPMDIPTGSCSLQHKLVSEVIAVFINISLIVGTMSYDFWGMKHAWQLAHSLILQQCHQQYWHTLPHTCISAIIRKQVKPPDGQIPQAKMEHVEQKCMQSAENSGNKRMAKLNDHYWITWSSINYSLRSFLLVAG
jgi:hypothetical protein